MLKENNILWSIGQLATTDLSNVTDGNVELDGKDGKYKANINEIAMIARDRIQNLELAMLEFLETKVSAQDKVEMFLEDFEHVLSVERNK